MDIKPVFAMQHNISASRVSQIVAAATKGDEVEWTMPPVLVIEDDGNGYTVLDGHHRGTAAQELGLETIPAWVVSIADYAAIVEADFDGSAPNRLSDLREHIICGDVDGDNICEHGA